MTSLVVASNAISNYCKQCKENSFSLHLPACCETGLYNDVSTEAYTIVLKESNN